MCRDSYILGIKTIDDQHQELLELTNTFVEQLERNVSRAILYKYLDDIYMKYLVHFSYENNIMSAAENINYTEHIQEHNSLLKELSAMYVSSINGQTPYSEISKFLTTMIDDHSKDFDLDLIGEKDFTLAFENLRALPGGIIVLTYEYGHFIKFFGEINEELMSMLILHLSNLRKDPASKTLDWGEVVDVRSWDLLTHKSFGFAKANASDERRTFSIYMIGDSKTNEYLVRSYIKHQKCDTFLTENLLGVLSIFSEETYDFGELKHFDCIGNSEYI